MSVDFLDQATLQLERVTCYECGLTFAVNKNWVKDRRDDHEIWYCPNGHSQYFPGKSDAEKLRDELARVKQEKERTETWLQNQVKNRTEERDIAQKSLRATKGVVTRIKKRVCKGVCPCCNRYFSALHRHMQAKHPDYHAENVAPAP